MTDFFDDTFKAECRECDKEYRAQLETDVPICDACYDVQQKTGSLGDIFGRYGSHGDDVPISMARFRKQVWTRCRTRGARKVGGGMKRCYARPLHRVGYEHCHINAGDHALRPMTECAADGVVRYMRLNLKCAEKLAREGLLVVTSRAPLG